MNRNFVRVIKSIVILVVAMIGICTTAQAKAVDSCKFLFDGQGIATEGLSDLLDEAKTKIQSPKNIYNVDDSPDVEKWRTHPGVERWDLELPNKIKNSANSIIDICDNLGMKEKVLPKNSSYSGVLFLGASFKTVVNRLEFYTKLLNEGVISKELKVWVLTGERKLNKKVGETKENFLELIPSGEKPLPLPRNEFEMIKYVFHYKMPKNVRVGYIYSKKDPNHTRATTMSTVHEFAKRIPESSQTEHYLAISNQPYVDYQKSAIYLALEKMGRKNIEVHVIGGRAKENDNLNNRAAILLDTVSKIISNCKKLFDLSEGSENKKLCSSS